jgi:hypothetical protein
MTEVAGEQKTTEKLKQLRKLANSSQSIPGSLEWEEKLKVHSQGKPDGPHDRLSTLMQDKPTHPTIVKPSLEICEIVIAPGQKTSLSEERYPVTLLILENYSKHHLQSGPTV